MADLQEDPRDELTWNDRPLAAVDGMTDERAQEYVTGHLPVRGFMPSLHGSLADDHRRLGEPDRAHEFLGKTRAGSDALGDDAYGALVSGILDKIGRHWPRVPPSRCRRTAAVGRTPPAGPEPMECGWINRYRTPSTIEMNVSVVQDLAHHSHVNLRCTTAIPVDQRSPLAVFGTQPPRQADVDHALGVAPFRGVPKGGDQVAEGRLVGRGELEPGHEVEWFTQVAAVLQAARHGRRVRHPGGCVPGPFLQQFAALVLGQRPGTAATW